MPLSQKISLVLLLAIVLLPTSAKFSTVPSLSYNTFFETVTPILALSCLCMSIGYSVGKKYLRGSVEEFYLAPTASTVTDLALKEPTPEIDHVDRVELESQLRRYVTNGIF